MKRGRNLLNKCFSNHKREKAAKRVNDLKGGSSYEETLEELRELIKTTEKENKDLKNIFWEEFGNNNSLNHIQCKVLEGWAPNELECDKIGILRI